MQKELIEYEEACYASASFPDPRDFQVVAHDNLRKGAIEGHRKQIVMAPTGSGKTYLAMRVIQEALLKGRSAMFVCDRTTLINQTSSVADEYGLSAHGIIQASHWRVDKRSKFQIASCQTLARRGWPDVDVLVVDECFPGETIIDTPAGKRRIDTLYSGEVIYNSCGEGEILSVFKRQVFSTLIVRLSDGTHFECTAEHPVLTDMGWRPASTLARGTRLFRLDDMPGLWGKIPSEDYTDGSSCGISRLRNYVQEAGLLREILRKEIEQPNGQNKRSGEDGCIPEVYWSQAENPRWKRTRDDCSTKEAGGTVGGRVVARSDCEDPQATGTGVSPSLQVGHWQCGKDDCCRGGRQQPLLSGTPGEGRKEGFATARPRVESVEVIEHPGGVDVYNLRVGGHPSYFANGILVHNCQTMYKTWVDHVETCRAHVIGLSATPFSSGLGKIFTNLINAATMDDLVQRGVLVPMRIYSCARIDMHGAKTIGGEWSEGAAAERGMEIIGDVVAEWSKYSDGRKTIVFGATIAHCEAMTREFNEQGIMAACFTSDTEAGEREFLLNEYRKPDSSLRVLISVEALAKGFDVPDVGCICDCRPLRKSLSTAIQMWGRGMRSSPGKTDVILLDFSGNIVRFADDFSDIYYNGLDALDMGDKLDKVIREDDEEKPEGSPCPECGYTPCGKRCVSCGYERVKQNLVEHQAGEMIEFSVGKAKIGDKLAVWSQCVTLCRGQGKPETAPGRAAHLYKSITGVFPRGMPDFDQTPNVTVSRAVINKQRSRQIAYRMGSAA